MGVISTDELGAVVAALMAKARAGHVQAAALLLEHALGRPRVADAAAVAPLELGELKSLQDCTTAAARVVAAVTAGTLGLDQGRALAEMVNGVRVAIESSELERRLQAVEARLDQSPFEDHHDA